MPRDEASASSAALAAASAANQPASLHLPPTDTLLLRGLPLQAAIAAARSPDYFNLGNHSAYSMKRSLLQQSNISTSTDMIQNVKHSIDSKMVSLLGLERAPLSSSSSRNMIHQVKNSINLKARVGHSVPAEVSQKTQDRLNEIRDSIDMKRIVTQLAPKKAEALGSPRDQESLVSYASSASFYKSEDDDEREELDELDEDDRSDADTPRIHVEDHGGQRVLRRKPPPVSSLDEALGREKFGFDSDLSFNRKISSYSDLDSSMSPLEHAGVEEDPTTGGSASSLGVGPDGAASTSTLPQFPSLAHRSSTKSVQKHGGFFRRRERNPGMDPAVAEATAEEANEDEDEDESELTDAAPRNTIVAPQQTVQLKTTMRKTNKRKEKRERFNENKPWKNHNECLYVSEQERKRYEGVWVSNKGLYLRLVVTRLVGVDYDAEPDMATPTEEMSLRAAQLLSKLENQDAEDFHGLVSADLNQLIHGVVVRRLWQRSRLPDETLEAVWNLVDFRKDGTLNKPEFLVGMWLVDQCLYGRKLPKTVDPIVWDSLGSIGLNVVVKKKGRR
jgi:hypothetical protein